MTCAAVSADGRSIAIGAQEPGYEIYLHDLLFAETADKLQGHSGPITALAFSSDGRFLLSAAGDTTALVWQSPRLNSTSPKSAQVDRAAARALWRTVGSRDAGPAFEALRALAGSPGDAIRTAREVLKPVPIEWGGRVRELISLLDSSDFRQREAASAELKTRVDDAEPYLLRGLEASPSDEVRRRIESILDTRKGGRSREALQAIRGIELLEWIGGDDATALLSELAAGEPGARATREADAALKRIRLRDKQR
jgi:hypothetical protein